MRFGLSSSYSNSLSWVAPSAPKAWPVMGMRAQHQARRRDVIPDNIKQMVWMRGGGGAGNAAHRRSFSTTTSSRLRWVAAATLRTCRSCVVRATVGRVLAHDPLMT
jgi:hypothetical protein